MTAQEQVILYGYCKCGCGNQTMISEKTVRRDGYVKGEPRKFCHGHGGKVPRLEPRAGLLDGYPVAYVDVTRNLETIVDIDDLEAAKLFDWVAKWDKHSETFYARSGYWLNGKKVHVDMHRHLLGLERGNPLKSDHKNGNGLDNRRRVNLRVATNEQNGQNVIRRKSNTSGYKGVSMLPDGDKWRARITVNGEEIHLGVHDTKEKAYAAYCSAATRLHGEFARLA